MMFSMVASITSVASRLVSLVSLATLVINSFLFIVGPAFDHDLGDRRHSRSARRAAFTGEPQKSKDFLVNKSLTAAKRLICGSKRETETGGPGGPPEQSIRFQDES
jgi:hypothetical protein